MAHISDCIVGSCASIELPEVDDSEQKDAIQETSDIPLKIIRTSTQKSGSSVRRSLTMGQCVTCAVAIIRVSQVIMSNAQLPPVISTLITEYFDNRDQYIGYVLLHKRSRRCVHVLCNDCYETTLDLSLSSYKIWIKCPHPRCEQVVYPTYLYPSSIR
jgi:transglutaminase/protease-like cytokinesis protein 3